MIKSLFKLIDGASYANDDATNFNRNQMGANAEGELNDGKYAVEIMRTDSRELGNSGKLNITTTFDSLRDFVANYKVSVRGAL